MKLFFEDKKDIISIFSIVGIIIFILLLIYFIWGLADIFEKEKQQNIGDLSEEEESSNTKLKQAILLRTIKSNIIDLKNSKNDPFDFIKKVGMRRIAESDKDKYLVLKYSYVLYNDKNEVMVISRGSGNHSSIVVEKSVMLSTGMYSSLGSFDNGIDETVINYAYPLINKIGVLASSFELELKKYKKLKYPTATVAWAYRETKNNKKYLFLIHTAKYRNGMFFPEGANLTIEALIGKDEIIDGDIILGFQSIDSIWRELKNNVDSIPVDLYALSLLDSKISFKVPDGMYANKIEFVE